ASTPVTANRPRAPWSRSPNTHCNACGSLSPRMRTDAMIRTPRPLLAVALGALMLTGLSACGEDDGQGEAFTEINLVFDNALTVCTDMPYEPFEYRVNGQPTGFDMELARRVAEDLDLDLDVLDVSFDDISSGAALNSDTCDLAVSAISITGERARVIDFSSPYFDAKQ